MAVAPAPLSYDRLRQLVQSGDVDTVIVAFTDVQGRLQGKRVHARHFLDEVAGNGTEVNSYLLAVDVEMNVESNTVPGHAISSWMRGYGDLVLKPDFTTLRPAPWLPSSALVLCDVQWHDGSSVPQSPRQVLKTQVQRAAELGYLVYAGTELEFLVFDDTYEQAWDAGYRGLTPSNRYNVDYSVIGTGRVESLLRDLRNEMAAAGMVVESAKGECNRGQHEIAFKHAEAVTTADNHTIYKTAAKEIAARHGKSLTFMAAFDERKGNSCHVHLSLRGRDGSLVFAEGERGRSLLFRQFLAGVLATLREFTLLYAPNINSYKRFTAGRFSPTAVAWGEDNRTCSIRVIGAGPGLRLENRVPGGDVNPYLALAALIAGGLYGIESNQPLESAFVGNAYGAVEEGQRARVPRTLAEAREEFHASQIARTAFGDAVVAHYVNAADVELRAFESAVTDWERRRGFERL